MVLQALIAAEEGGEGADEEEEMEEEGLEEEETEEQEEQEEDEVGEDDKEQEGQEKHDSVRYWIEGLSSVSSPREALWQVPLEDVGGEAEGSALLKLVRSAPMLFI